MIAVALVPIARDTGVSAATAVWLVADMFDPRKVYFFGLIMAAVCGLIPTLFPSFLGALIARLGIGIGTSVAYPAVMVLIRDDAERHGRDTPKGLLAAVSFSSLATATVGPVLGGVLVDTFVGRRFSWSTSRSRSSRWRWVWRGCRPITPARR